MIMNVQSEHEINIQSLLQNASAIKRNHFDYSMKYCTDFGHDRHVAFSNEDDPHVRDPSRAYIN